MPSILMRDSGTIQGRTDSRLFVIAVREARKAREAAVAERNPFSFSLSFLAREYGIVPHGHANAVTGCCANAVHVNRTRAATLRATSDENCPEYCGHPGRCADDRAAISAAERAAEARAERWYEEGF